MKGLIDQDIVAYVSASLTDGKYYQLITPSFTYTGDKKKELNEICKDMGIDKSEITTHYSPEPVENALHTCKMKMESILNAINITEYKGFLTGNGNFRESITEAASHVPGVIKYKGNRDTIRRPHHLKACREYLIKYWNGEVIHGYEADDALGWSQEEDTVICTIDKDLDQISGWHYNWDKKSKYYVTPEQGLKFFYKQLLMGDKQSDNIPGIHGLGPVTANKLIEPLTKEKDMFLCCAEQYAKAGLTLDNLLVSAQLLYIMKSEDDIWEIPE